MARYTADELRDAANAVDEVSINDNGEYFYEKHDKFNPFLVRDMLRHSADLMEREKKYEYAILWDYDDSLCEMSIFYEYIKRRMDEINSDGVACHLVRRSVGEWEEVEA